MCHYSRKDVSTSRKRELFSMFNSYASCPLCTCKLFPDHLLLSHSYRTSPAPAAAALSSWRGMTARFRWKSQCSAQEHRQPPRGAPPAEHVPALGGCWPPSMPSEALTCLSADRNPFSALSPCSSFHTGDGQTYTRCAAEISSRLLLACRGQEDTLGGHLVQMSPSGKLGCICPCLSSLFLKTSRGDLQPAQRLCCGISPPLRLLRFPKGEAEHFFLAN